MSLFDTILANHHLENCPLPLWRIKVTDDEYETLKLTLAKETRMIGRMPFMSVTRECTLLYAEYWRREYSEGSHSKQMVFNCLPDANPYLLITGDKVDMCEQLYLAARKGAKNLGIEILSFENTHYVESLLYQGGLPMKLIVGSDTYGVWERFVRGLVFKNVNFDELDLGTVASNSTSMRMYCNQICDSVDARQFLLLPFHAEDETNPWYQFLINRFKSIRRRERMSHPFTLDWEFVINDVDKKISAKYDMKGVQKLSEVFVEQQKLGKTESISVSVLRNGKVADGFDYYNLFCRYAVRSKRPYNIGDVISLYIHNQEQPHISETLDMETPHLLYRCIDGSYHMGNQIGKEESFLLIPEGWVVESPHCEIDNYKWNDVVFRGFHISADHTDDVIVTGPDGAITYGCNNVLYWTEIFSSPLAYMGIVDEFVYDVPNTRFTLCHDGEENVVKQFDRPVEYRSKWEKVWTNEPSYGEIFVRAKASDSTFVTPTKVFNIGDGLKIHFIEANDSSCQIRVEWPYGKIACPCGTKHVNDIWIIKKEDCEDKHKLPFIFTPEHNHLNAFTLHIKAPFKEFSIEDEQGNPIKSGCTIPYADMDKYQYHLVGINIRKLQFGNEERSLKWIGNTLYMYNISAKTAMPYEGNFSRLFGSREILRTMLDKTAMSMLEAIIPVKIELSDGQLLTLTIKEAPFRPREEEGKLTISCNWRPIEYKHTLKLLSLDEPTISPIDLPYDNDNGYVVPEEIRKWGKTLVIGRSRGRICPTMIDLTQDLTSEARKSNRDSAIQRINNELNSATIGDSTWSRILAWFDNCQKYDIPASSLLDLMCVGNNQDDLIRFAFMLWTMKDDKELLIDRLQIFAKDLAFQWFWLTPKVNGIFRTIEPFIGDPSSPAVIKVFSQWAINKGKIELIYTINTEAYFMNFMDCMQDLLNEFVVWFKKLCLASACDTYVINKKEEVEFYANQIINEPKALCYSQVHEDMYVELNQDELDDDTRKFFDKYAEGGKSHNEAWMYKRVNILYRHLIGEENIFEMPLKVRRSIAFCYQSTTPLFIVALNNKLVTKNYQ